MIQQWRTGDPLALGLASGIAFGAISAILMIAFHADGGHWPWAALTGVIGGSIFGTVMGPYTARLRSSERASVGADDDAYRATARSLRRSTAVPSEPASRRQTLALARQRLEVLERQRVWGTVLFTVLALLSLAQAVTSSPWHGLPAAFFLVMLVLTWWQRRSLRAKVASLASGPPGDPAGAVDR